MKLIKFFNDGADDAVISHFAEEFKINKKVMEIIYSKGYKTKEAISNFLMPTKLPFVDPYKLSGMQQCVEKIRQAVFDNKDILVFGDYDVDGISATAIMLQTLKIMGNNASYYLPNRFIDGYGLTKEVIDKICKIKKPDLIITVDCGITCYKEVEYCKELGIDIVVTDHHEIPEILPDCIVVNPKLPNQDYKFNGLCGTGVAFKISQALLSEQDSEMFLPIASIATISDIVPLVDENRIIVAKGLEVFSKYLPYGLKVLFKQNKLNLEKIDASDIAFKIAPKLNASGRMGDASDSLELILQTNPTKVRELLEKINNHNSKRQELCNKIFEDCMQMLKSTNMSKIPAIILKSNNWDSGILGIVCSRLVEKFNRPTILLSESNGELKGSARSIEDVNIHQILSSVKDILEVFGGHKVAAGLTLKSENFEEFRNRVCSFMIQNINSKAFMPIDYYDIEITSDDLTSDLFNDLKLIEPCGCDNQKPRFLIRSSDIRITPLKPNSLHSSINIKRKLNLIFFNYLKNYPRLNFGKEYDFVFELQSFSKGIFKGIVKTFTTSDEIKDSAEKYFNAFKFNQFLYLNSKDECKINNYKENNLIDFVVDCSSSVFGTCFVCFNTDRYQKFISSYSLDNIFEINFLETSTTGFNSINLCPLNLDWAKSYKRIIFLDTVLDLSYISAIKKISSAEIYIPEINAEDKKLFNSINLERREITKFYVNLTKIENNLFTNLLAIYSKLIKDLKYKINFNNFVIYYYILCELNIVIPNEKDGLYCFKINKKIKTELNKSKIYNSINLIRKIYG